MPLVRNPTTGEIRVVEGDAKAFLEQGWHEPTTEELEGKAKELEYGTTGQQIQAQAERFTRGLTLGQVEGFGSNEENRARAEVSEELSPGISTAVDIAPAVALGAATGGAATALGAGATGALLATELAGGAVQASQQAFAQGRQYLHDDIGTDVENTAIWTGLGFALGKVMPGMRATGKAVSKGEVATAEEIAQTAAASEAKALKAAEAAPLPEQAGAASRGEPLTSDPGTRAAYERATAGDAAEGATGASAKGAEGVPTGEPTPVAPKIPEKPLGEQVAREAADDGFERAVRRASESDAQDIVERATREAVEPEKSSIFRDRRLYANREAILDTATKELQEDFTDVVKQTRAITDDKGALAARNVSDNIGAQRTAARTATEEAAKWAGKLKAEAKQFAAASGKKGLLYPISSQKALTAALLEHAEEIGKATTGREMFGAMNKFKQVVDDFKTSLEAGAKNSENPIYHERLIPQLSEFAGTLRRQLENAETWGKAGEIQAAYNRTFTDKFIPSFKTFEESVMKRTHKGYDAMWETEGWESKIRSLLENADPGARRHVDATLDAMREFAEAQAKYGDKRTAQGVLEKVDKIQRTLGLGQELADATERMEALGTVAGVLPFIGTAAKATLSGDLGVALRRLSGSTEATINKSVDDWIRSSRIRGGAKLPETARIRISPERQNLINASKRKGISVGLMKFMGDDDSPSKAFERRRSALMDDDGFFERLSGDFPSLQRQSPEAFMLLSGKVAEARQFLIARMPANVAVSVMRPGGYPPSKDAIEDWAVYWNAVEEPLETVKNIGSMRIQEAETVQTLYPRLWEQTQQTVLEKISGAEASGHPLDDVMLMRLDLLFGFDGAGSSAFSMAAAKAARSVAAPEAGGSSGGGSMDSAKRLAPQNIALTGATMGSVG